MTQVLACPECDSANTHRRVSAHFDSTERRNNEGRWYCNDCGAGFEEPIRRESRTEASIGYAGDAAKLDAADPDEFP